jgi:hypothetical protein
MTVRTMPLTDKAVLEVIEAIDALIVGLNRNDVAEMKARKHLKNARALLDVQAPVPLLRRK